MEKIKEDTKPTRPILKNILFAFLIGGAICFIAQALTMIFSIWFDEVTSSTITIILMVGLGVLLTGLGIYDKIGQIAGAGTIIPITGFANSMASSAIESKTEGVVLGIITNIFKLAGAVIATGIISSAIIITIRYLVSLI